MHNFKWPIAWEVETEDLVFIGEVYKHVVDLPVHSIMNKNKDLIEFMIFVMS